MLLAKIMGKTRSSILLYVRENSRPKNEKEQEKRKKERKKKNPTRLDFLKLN
jgi:hypothetical protein